MSGASPTSTATYWSFSIYWSPPASSMDDPGRPMLQARAPRGTYWRRQRAGLIGRAGWRTRRVRGHVGLVDALPRPDRGRPRARVASKPRPVGLVRLRERVRWAA